MSMAVVTKSPPVLVVPPPPLTGGDVDAVSLTSSLDRTVVPFPVTSVLLFDRPIPNTADTIKAALSSVLAHYRPIAGRLAFDDDDDDNQILRIEGAAGVPFVAASATCALADVTTAVLGELVVQYPGDFCRHADPLLMVQVTEFGCGGGFAVAATWNHVLTDGAGMAQFLGAVAELARGGALPSVVPLRSDDGSLPRLPASKVAAQKLTMSLVANTDFVLLDLAVPASLVARVKAEFQDEPPCTVFEAVAAVLWRCRTRAAGAGDGAMMTLSFPSNVRGLVGARRGYYGNCVVVQTLRAPRHAVADGDIAGVVRMIRRAKERIPELLLMEEASNGAAVAAGEGEGEGGAEEDQGGMEPPYNTFVVSSWRNLGFDGVDFGSGTPTRVMWHGENTVVPGCVVCPPEKDGDGVKVISLCVRPEHVDAFQSELAREASVVAK